MAASWYEGTWDASVDQLHAGTIGRALAQCFVSGEFVVPLRVAVTRVCARACGVVVALGFMPPPKYQSPSQKAAAVAATAARKSSANIVAVAQTCFYGSCCCNSVPRHRITHASCSVRQASAPDRGKA